MILGESSLVGASGLKGALPGGIEPSVHQTSLSPSMG